MYVTTKRQEIPREAGISVVASALADAFCVQPIKKSPNSAVDGNPPMSPPIFDPNLSAATVEIIVYNPPIKKDKISFIKKRSITHQL